MCCYQTFFYFFIYFPRTVRSVRLNWQQIMGVLCLHFLLNKFVFYLDFCLCFGVYPMKFATTRWRTMWAKRKSANARSGRMLSKLDAFTGLACILRLTPKMKLATQLMKPDRNALNGKVPTRQQWKQMEGNLNFLEKIIFFMKHEFLADYLKNKGLTKTTIITHL